MAQNRRWDGEAQPSYLDIIGQLPIPTAEQTRNFAEYVAGAHSWYKHLPVYPPAPFVFYLDPNAGRGSWRARSSRCSIAKENGRLPVWRPPCNGFLPLQPIRE